MLARLLRGVMGAVAAAALLWGAALWQRGYPAAALAGALVLLTLHAWVLAGEFAAMAWVNRRDPAPPAAVRQYVHAWWTEVITFSVAFGWHQAWRADAVPDHVPDAPGEAPAAASGNAASARAGAPRGIVLIHGYMSNRGVWAPWHAPLRAAGVPYIAVTLEPVFGALDGYAPQVEAAVQRLERATGAAPVLVCHSMGGLVARAWLRWQRTHGRGGRGGSEARVQRVITIGTPHQGTWMARTSRAANARQARVRGPWLHELAASEPPERRARFTCFYSHCDNMVFPASSAVLPGSQAEHVPGLAHVDLAYDARVVGAALRAAGAA